MIWALYFVFFFIFQTTLSYIKKKKKKNLPHPRQLTYWANHLPGTGLPAIGFYSFNYKIISTISGWLLD